ncbi:DMP19 family protein [Paenarthrobacter sp. NyZ202]|uniref:DMP19 family protein n=1 Tax=Paenarthrobacter sp. NyZ202 TaxID=3402689 RepID=UPI003CFA9BCF
MTTNEYPVVLNKSAVEAGSADVVDSNVNVVNEMYAELLNSDEIAPAALNSYFVDFYLTQALAGGFAQYVFTAPEREEVDGFVRAGLEAIGAHRHADLFDRTAAAFDALTEDEAEAYLDGELDDTEGVTAPVALLDELDGEFEALLEEEDLVELNGEYLRRQPDLLALSDEDLEAHIAERVSRIPDLAGRQAEAEEEALASAPDFEIIIRELCDVAGYQLERITMGDPNYDHDGGTILAWHFSTDHGDYIMIEEEDEAFMIHPETKEIIAAVEFEESDEFVEA